MSEIIITLDQHEMDPTVSIEDRKSYYVRHAARAVLLDKSGRVVLMHAQNRDYYKLPGGGIDEGEEVEIALAREILEETGATADIIQNLGTVVEWRDFKKFNQFSHAFKALLKEQASSPTLTESELEEGFEAEWIENLDEAIKLITAQENRDDLDIIFMSKRDSAILRSAK
jgi:8-oxo-dGTP pyrophosphatase MutT (NUDIX family)